MKKSLLKTLRKIQSFLLPLFDRSSGVQLDLAIGISGFDKMILENATEISIGGENFSVATSKDLILMKIMAGRPQDAQDIKGLVAVNREQLNWDYCLDVARQLEDAIGIDMVEKIVKLRESE